jgi:hypothetical protein
MLIEPQVSIPSAVWQRSATKGVLEITQVLKKIEEPVDLLAKLWGYKGA